MVNSEEKLVDKQFAVDPLCSDVLMFPGEYREDLVDHDLYLGGKIVIQVLFISCMRLIYISNIVYQNEKKKMSCHFHC